MFLSPFTISTFAPLRAKNNDENGKYCVIEKSSGGLCAKKFPFMPRRPFCFTASKTSRNKQIIRKIFPVRKLFDPLHKPVIFAGYQLYFRHKFIL
jgi:hypothetical protein